MSNSIVTATRPYRCIQRARFGAAAALFAGFCTLQMTGCDSTTPGNSATYSVGGSVSGLNGKLVLVNNDFDALSVAANGPFRFTLTSSGGSPYAVVLSAEPGSQVCTIANGSGVIANADITNVSVTCSTSGESPVYAFTGGANGSAPNSGLTEGTDGNYYGTTTYGGANNLGTIYRITPAGAQTVLYSFRGGASDGQYPASGLELGDDGVFYVTTTAGGAFGKGTFFRITQSGAGTLLYSFGGSGSGAEPQGLTLLDDGNFYGTTTSGGAHGLGTVFKITASGVHTVLYSFKPGTDGQLPAAGLSPSPGGQLYGVTFYGGANGVGTLYRINPDGTGYASLYSFGASAVDGSYPGVKLRQANGDLYGSTGGGGTAGFGTVFKYSPATGATTVIHSFAGAPTDPAYPSSRLRVGPDGNLYGVSYYGGYFDGGAFFRMTLAGDVTTLYSFSVGEGGLGPNSSLLLSASGEFYGTTVLGGPTNNGTIYKIRP